MVGVVTAGAAARWKQLPFRNVAFSMKAVPIWERREAAPSANSVCVCVCVWGKQRRLHGLKFSIATTDFRHSNFSEATCEIDVDRRRTNVGWFLLTDCNTLQPMVSLTACAQLTNDSVVTNTGRDLNTEQS